MCVRSVPFLVLYGRGLAQLNGMLQLLVYAVNINIVGGSIRTTKNKTDV